METDNHQLTKRAHLKKCIRSVMSSGSEISLESGETVSTYFDIRALVADPKHNKLVAEVILEKIESVGNIESIGGLAMGAIALCQGISTVAYMSKDAQYNTFFIRKSNKTYGLQKQIEGIARGSIAIIDDVFKTGNSVSIAKQALENISSKITLVIPLIYRGSHNDLQADCKRLKLTILPIFMEGEFDSEE